MQCRRLLSALAALTITAIASADTVDEGLVARWAADGDAVNSVSGQSGTLNAVGFAPGYSGQAFSFSGNGWIDLGSEVGNFGTGDFTISFWIRPSGSGYQSILGKRPQCDAPTMFDLRIRSATITCEISESPYKYYSFETAVPALTDGAFHHLAVVRTASLIALYCDGVLQAVKETPTAANVSSSAKLLLGSDPCVGCDGTRYFQGLLDEIQLYNRALNGTQIYALASTNQPLRIVSQPGDQQTIVGKPVVFNVTALGSKPLHYQWRINGTNISGATKPVIVLENPQLEDAGLYSVVVSDAQDAILSREARLRVLDLPPVGEGVIARWSGEGDCQDSIGTFHGLSTGLSYMPGVLGYAFKFNGLASIDFGNEVGNFGTNDFTIDYWIQTPFKGYSEAVMHKRGSCGAGRWFDFRCGSEAMGLELDDYGRDYVVVNSASKPIQLSDGVFHHVAATRRGTQLSLYIDGLLGETVTSREVLDLSNDASFIMGADPCNGVDGTLTFRGMLDEVQFHNRALTDREVYNLYQPDPTLSIFSQPRNRAVVEGSNAVLTVGVAGAGPFSYQWRLNGQDIAQATGSAYSIPAAAVADAGIYSVMVTSPNDTVCSADAKLTVVPASTVLPGLVNKWSGEGNVDDLVGKSAPTILLGSYASGAVGQGFNFNDRNGLPYDNLLDREYVQLDPQTGNFGTNDFTIDFWMRSPAGAASWTQMVLGKHTYSFQLSSAGYLGFTLGGCSVTGPASISDGNFHHIAAVRLGSEISLYIDGVQVGTGTLPLGTTVVNNNNFMMAWDWDGGAPHPFIGQLDEIEIYNRALAAGEIAGLFHAAALAPRAGGPRPTYNAYLGGTVTFTNLQNVTGPGPLSYQWQVNGIEIAGATDSSLVVTNIGSGNAGVYACTVSNPYGSITCPLGTIAIQLSPGTYNGLFYLESETTDESWGFITLTLSHKQVYSGRINQHGTNSAFTGKFSGNRTLVSIKRSNGRPPLSVSMSAAMDNGFNRVRGLVRDGNRSIPLVANRATYSADKPTPQAGKYTVCFVGTNSVDVPAGNGFGRLEIGRTNGLIRFGAKLADGTPVTQGVAVANSGVWPLYIPLYKGRGSALGWLSFTNTSESRCAGTLRWIKSAGIGTNYVDGFSTKVPVMGSGFAPATTGLGIDLSSASVLLSGDGFVCTNRIVSTNRNMVYFSQPGTNNGVLSLAPLTGEFSGNFIHPITRKRTPINGVVLQDQSFGAGYFLTTNQSGRVALITEKK